MPLGIAQLPNYDFFDKTQFFPLYRYTAATREALVDGVFAEGIKLDRSSNVNPLALDEFRAKYNDDALQGDDLFFFVYALLNSKKYLDKYATLLGKEMPPIPFPKVSGGVATFIGIGKTLFDLHTDWKSLPPFDEQQLFGSSEEALQVDDITKKLKLQKSGNFLDLKYGQKVLVSSIPQSVLDLKYNGMSPLEWALKRTKTRYYKKSCNSDDINELFKELGVNPTNGFLDYLKKIITMSLCTLDALKKLDQIKLEFFDECSE